MMSRQRINWLTAAALAALSAAVGTAQAQEERPAGEVRVTPWGRVLDFGPDGGWRARARQVARVRSQLVAGRDFTRLNTAVQAGAPVPASAAVTGTLRVPAIVFGFQDRATGAVNDTSKYRQLLFDAAAPAGTPYSLRSFYAEISNGLLDYVGRVLGWVTLSGNEPTYTGAAGSCPDNPFGTNNCNGIFSNVAYAGLVSGLRQALAAVDDQVDFAQFDGDDNGIVDFALFLQSEQDGACLSATNNHIWAHRSSGLGYVTDDPSPAGGNVVVSDYIIQSAVGGSSGCDSTQVMAIGTAAHESGHAFGLPDLYDTSREGEGIGQWGLMGSGNWATQRSPAHMEAWSRDQLGWVTVAPLTSSGTYSLGPTAVGDTVYHILPTGANPRGEYFLVENRQGVLSDSALIRVHCAESGLSFPTSCGGGLAIWHIDGIKSQGFAVNAGTPQGVLLTQADGLGQLQTGTNRGDAGDLYPGIAGNTAFGPATNPAAVNNQGAQYVGFYLDSIVQLMSGGAMSFRLQFGEPPLVTTSVSAPPAVMGAEFVLLPTVSGGLGNYSWTLANGVLPQGLTMAASGRISGIPEETGSFPFTLRVTSGNQSEDLPVTLTVSAPALTSETVVSVLLGTGGALTTDERRYLDLLGNRNGSFDVGDFLAFIRITGGSVSAATMAELLRKEGAR